MNIAFSLISACKAYENRIAISDPDTSLTYREVLEQASVISLGIKSQELSRACIAVSIPDPIEHLIAILGVILSGNYYISITPDNEHLLKAASLPVSLVLDEPSCLDKHRPAEASSGSHPHMSPKDPLCAFFTSGSTSTPKTIIHSHQTIVNDTARQIRENHISTQDKIDLVFSLSFSASLACIFPALLSGAELCIFDVKTHGINGLINYWERKQITFTTLSVSTFENICRLVPDSRKLALRFISISAEPVTDKTLELFRKKFDPAVVLQIAYATTETRTIAEYKLSGLDISPSGNLLGKVVTGVEVAVVSKEGSILPPRAVGEIVISSPDICHGYYNNPEETSRCFDLSQDPIWFRTGDQGYLDEMNYLFYSGRISEANKINGIKLNLRLIEEQIENYYNSSQCRVVVNHSGAQKRLIAFIQSETAILRFGDLKDYLEHMLPPNHIPALFVQVTSFPQTHSGKIDRKQLETSDPRIFETPVQAQLTEPRENRAEDTAAEQIVRIFRQVLESPSIGIADNFFEAGGDSLTALSCVAELEADLARPIPVLTLYDHPTAERLASVVAINHTRVISKTLINGYDSARKSVYLVYGSPTGSYTQLIPLLSKRFNVYQLHYSILSVNNPSEADKIADQLVEAVEHEECIVMGFSFQGYLAHHIATRSSRVAYCVLFDTYNYFDYSPYLNRNPFSVGNNLLRLVLMDKYWRLVPLLIKGLYKKVLLRLNRGTKPTTEDLHFIRAINIFTERHGYKATLNHCISINAAYTAIRNKAHGKGWARFTGKKFQMFTHPSTHNRLLADRDEQIFKQLLSAIGDK